MYVPGPENYLAEGIVNHNTGVGKGRQIAGIILDNWRRGRTKAVWVSKTPDLIHTARGDVTDVGGVDPKKLFGLKDVKATAGEDRASNIEAAEGILFASYSSLGRGHQALLTEHDVDAFWQGVENNTSRLAQMVRWLGKDFDGVIAFDEAHKAGNAIAIRGARGVKDPSLAGVAVVDLQRLLPKARIVYVSATGATEVENLSYADRLGIWGQNTPFRTKLDFFTQIRAGGMSAMEITARDLKAMGAYLARSISFKGIKFDRITHNLTPDQEAMYDRIAGAWQLVLSHIDEALEETGGNRNRRAASAAKSAFWGAQQRFFNQLLTSLQMPSLFEDMDKQLAAGKSILLQLVNTNEASEGRAINKARRETEEGQEVPYEDLDLSPMDILLQLIDRSYPTALYEEQADPNNPDRTVWVPVLDSEGKRVHSQELLAKKQALLDELATMPAPDNVLKQILDRYGAKNVAEITGRGQRVVTATDKNGNPKTIVEKRSAAQRQIEAQEYNDGKRRILLFSDAGGTGFSFHASERFKNQQQRIHYLVQAGWRADNALQGLGRSHRTGEVELPHYKLLETNIKGHRRFIASIARRLAQLGALTQGERGSTGQGLFSEADNLENAYATGALNRLIFDLFNNTDTGDFTFDEFSEGLGFVKTVGEERVNSLLDRETGQLDEEQFPPIQRFLNRILALPLARQNALFDLFMARMERRIEQAKADGTFDEGTQIYKAKRIEKVADEVVADLTNGAAPTRIVTVNAFDDVVFTPFEDVAKNGAVMWARNRSSGKVYAFREGPNRTDSDTGQVLPTWRRFGTTGNGVVAKANVTLEPGTMVDGKLEGAGNYEEVTQEEAAALWDAEIAAHPKEHVKEATFLVGAMLPVWDRIGLARTRIFRFTTHEGEQFIGVEVPRSEVAPLRARMGAKNTITPEAAFEMVSSDGATLELANGWKIERRFVSGQRRMEVTGLELSEVNRFAADFDGFVERISFRPRAFVPDADSMAKVMAHSPVVKINGERVDGGQDADGGVAAPSAPPVAMRDYMGRQAAWLLEQARLRGYADFDEFFAQDNEAATRLMDLWSETHARPASGDVAGAADGEAEARRRVEALVSDSLGLATYFAEKYSNIPGVEFDDRLQAARLGLVVAAQTFDEARGVPFGAYASRIIKNELNGMFRSAVGAARRRGGELDAPMGQDGDTTGKDNVRAREDARVSAEDLATVREIVGTLPARPRRVWEALAAGRSLRDIGAEEGITGAMVHKIAKATRNTLRAELRRRGIESVDDVFPAVREEFPDRAAERRADMQDEEADKAVEGVALAAASAPRVEQVQASIDHDAEMVAAYRAQTASSRTFAGAISDAENLARMATDPKEFYATMLRGRLDKLEFYAPGAKEAILDNKRNEALVAATINGMMEQMRDDITRAFGYPKFWQKNKKRLQGFLDEILPVAARLEVERIDDEGQFVFRTFNMRAGTMPEYKARAMQLREGDTVPTTEGVFILGPKIEGGRHLLLQTITADVQQKIYEDFHASYPEAAHYLDRWIEPGMEEARYMGPNGTMTAEFNRHALRDLFNQWPQELRDLFGAMPLEDMPYVEGYTPDVAEAKTLVAVISSLLNRFRSGARKIKAGEARRSGNIKNLFDGFSIRAMEAHREKIRVLTRQRLIEAAAVPLDSIPLEERGMFVPVDQTFNKLLDAIKLAKRLHPAAFPAITGALSPKDGAAMAKLLGDAFRLRGRGLMIHTEVERELMLGAVRQVSNNILTKILAGLMERYNSGLLATPFTAITNWASNELTKVVRTSNRLLYTVFSLAAGDVRAARLSGWEFAYLLRGFITDRMPSRQGQRIAAIVPRELFEDQTALESAEVDPNTSVKQQLARLNVGGAFLQLVHYGDIDIGQKQQLAYAAYRAHAQVAWADAKRRGEIPAGTDKKAWTRNWMQTAPADFHRDVYLTTVLYLMDYQNVPAWLDPQQSMTATGQIFKRMLLPFAKWPYNMARQLKRLTVNAALDVIFKGKTKQQRINGMANLATMAGLTAVGALLVGADDDDDPLLGKSLDEEGNLLDAAYRTANRINLSRLARIVAAHGLMNDVDFTLDDGSGESKDLWWRYRNYPYLKEAIMIGMFFSGKEGKGWEQLTDVAEEYVSFGILSKLQPFYDTPFDQGKSYGYKLAEGIYDLTTTGLLPTPWRQLATRMVDPVSRRPRKLESLGYKAGPLDAIRVNTPFLSKTVPSTGTRQQSAFAPFSAEQWFKAESSFIKKTGFSPEDKKAHIDTLRKQAVKMNMTAQEQLEFFRAAGLPVEKMNMKETSTIPAVQRIRTLESLGVGPESFGVTERKNKKTGTKTTMLSIPDPASVGYQPRGLQALRFFGGVNLMAVPRQTIYRDEDLAE